MSTRIVTAKPRGRPRWLQAESIEKRMDRLFWPKVEVTGACWLWTASCSRNGYGQWNDGTGRMVTAHRQAYETLVGLVPVGLDLDHLCRVRQCVNPDHLEPVTRLENLRRGPSTIIAIQERAA